jgi:predicted alpha/beta hydrolase
MPHQQPILSVNCTDGHRFELIHVPATEARLSLLFMPGMGLSARQYIPFAQALAEQGVESYIHEWRGLGSSNLRASRAINWGYRELLDDLASAVDTIQARSGQRQMIFAGHSLGSQLACLLATRRPDTCSGLVIIAGGSPYWRTFGWCKGSMLRLGLSLMPAVAQIVGHYPGRQLGFAGREARGVMNDWTDSGRRGIYQPANVEQNLEAALAELAVPVLGLRLVDDWFVPEASLSWLTNKLASAEISCQVIRTDHPDHRADHFGWMQSPGPCSSAIVAWATSALQSTDASNRA